MKIGFVVNSLSPECGGGFTYESSILNALYKLSTDHEIFIFYNNSNEVLPKHNKIKFVDINEYSKINLKTRFLRIKDKIFKKKKEKLSALNKALLANNIHFVWLITPESEAVKVPYVFTVFDLQHRLQPYFPELLESWNRREFHYNDVIKKASFLIAGSETGKKEVEKFYGIPEERIKTIPIPTSEFVFQQAEKQIDIGTSEKYIFFPAQFWPHKNHVVILEALKILKKKYDINLHAVFTGSDKGNLSYIKKYAKNLGIIDNIKFFGFVEIGELIYLYKNAMSIVFPSFFGPDNLPTLEAMALKCPLVCTNSMQEHLGDTAIFFDNKNEEELTEILKKIYFEGYDEELIEKAYNRSISWTSENYLNSIMDLINDFYKIRRCWDYTY